MWKRNALWFAAGCVLTLLASRAPRRDPGSKPSARFLVACAVFSAPGNAERRQAIRDTWLTLAPSDGFVHAFLVGTGGLSGEARRALADEAGRAGDLLLLEHLADDYTRLTDKLIASVVWARDRGASHLLKVDDDSFVRADELTRELRARPPPPPDLYWGYFRGDARVRRRGRWAEPEWFLCDRYLPYALGGGYVVSAGVIAFVAENAPLLRRQRNEDASMGVWTAPLDRLERLHDVRFDTEWASRGCSHSTLVAHKRDPEDMRRMYRTVVRSGGARLCDRERTMRKPFVYDWKAPPSECCVPPPS